MDTKLTISLIQADLNWEDKAANLKMFEEKINAIEEKTEIVILPEMFSTGFSMRASELAEEMDGETIEWMKRISTQKKIILTGSLILEEKGNYYNRLVWMLPGGQYGYYDKRHLFAYAGEDKYYTAGNKRFMGSVKGWKINLQVCYDLRFPVWSRSQVHNNSAMTRLPLKSGNEVKQSGESSAGSDPASQNLQPEYDLLVYVANWPDRRSIAWKTLLQARAIENQCYVAGVNRVGKDALNNNYTGDSMIVDPLGEIIYQKKDEEDVFTCSLDKLHLDTIRQKLPFWKDGDNFNILD